jgi:XTP/dITP diphosphohydrolase
MKIVFATTNRGKLTELRELVAELPVEVVSIDELRPGWQVEETGATFVENATLKAVAAARATEAWALGDDSGLEVDALGGAPGVYSARYAEVRAGEQQSSANNEKLLRALAELPAAARSARFRCALALASPTGDLITVEGVCEGRVITRPRGAGGFGYDPLFEPEGLGGATMAELPGPDKNRISHRGRAFAALLPRLAAVVQGSP